MQRFGQPPFPPKNNRTHEVCGAGAFAFAFSLAGQLAGPFILVQERRDVRHLNPMGFATFVTPSEMTICRTGSQTETLAVAEDALRSGAVPLVVFILSKPIGLTEGRRLQLAARDGQSTGLAVISEDMGSNAAETRWRCTPLFDPEDSTLQKWELIKNKSGTLGIWHVRWDTASRRLTVVPPARK